IWGSLLLIGISCNKTQNNFDASGAFEAEELIVSAEAQGTLKMFDLEEGQTLKSYQNIGYIDSLQLYLYKKQLEAQIEAQLGKKTNITAKVSDLQEELNKAKTEKKRIENLVEGDAATPKQLHDINAEIEVLKNKIEAQKSSLSISSSGID